VKDPVVLGVTTVKKGLRVPKDLVVPVASRVLWDLLVKLETEVRKVNREEKEKLVPQA
jgi:hypothetical protein